MKIKPGAFWVSSCVLILNLICAHGVVDDKLEVLRLERHISETRNVQALQNLFEEREKEEQKDPLNFLGQLYKELEEQSRDQQKGDFLTTMDAIVDPPLAELQFHRKIPNCASEFNITRISELVEDDKKMRKLCPACNAKGMNSLLGWIQTSGAPFSPEKSPIQQMVTQHQQAPQEQIPIGVINLQQQKQQSNPPQQQQQNPKQNATQVDYSNSPHYPYKVNSPQPVPNPNKPNQSRNLTEGLYAGKVNSAFQMVDTPAQPDRAQLSFLAKVNATAPQTSFQSTNQANGRLNTEYTTSVPVVELKKSESSISESMAKINEGKLSAKTAIAPSEKEKATSKPAKT